MTDHGMALIELSQKTDDADFLESVAELTLQRLMEFEAEGPCGAAKHARSEARNHRNGCRAGRSTPASGHSELGITKLRRATGIGGPHDRGWCAGAFAGVPHGIERFAVLAGLPHDLHNPITALQILVAPFGTEYRPTLEEVRFISRSGETLGRVPVLGELVSEGGLDWSNGYAS